MLNLYFGFLKSAKRSAIFDVIYKPSWIMSDFSRRVIKEIDKCEVIDRNLIKSPVLGMIPPSRLSGGSKVLMVMRFSDTIVSLDSMGANCYKFLKEICDIKDVITCASNYYSLFLNGGFTAIRIINSNRVVTEPIEMFHDYNTYIGKAYDSEGGIIKVEL